MNFYAQKVESTPDKTTTSDISAILYTETSQNKHQTWSKLNKTDKIAKMNLYASQMGEEHQLDANEIVTLKRYMVAALERKRLTTVKDVVYDAETGCITNIPALSFDANERTFSLQRSTSRTSTLTSLTRNKKQN
jgi:hypothetical protein